MGSPERPVGLWDRLNAQWHGAGVVDTDITFCLTQSLLYHPSHPHPSYLPCTLAPSSLHFGSHEQPTKPHECACEKAADLEHLCPCTRVCAACGRVRVAVDGSSAAMSFQSNPTELPMSHPVLQDLGSTQTTADVQRDARPPRRIGSTRFGKKVQKGTWIDTGFFFFFWFFLFFLVFFWGARCQLGVVRR